MRQRCFQALVPLASLLALTALSPVAFARPRPAAAAPASGEPTLSAAQQAKIKARNQQFQKDMAALQADTKMSATDKRARFQSLYQVMDKDMLAILTPAQRAQVMQTRQAALQQREEQQRGFEAFQKSHSAEISAAEKLGQKIHASIKPAQKQQLDAIASATQAQQQQIAASKGLTDQEKRTKLLALVQSAQAKSLAVLTSSQRADFEKLRKMQEKLTAEAQAAGASKR